MSRLKLKSAQAVAEYTLIMSVVLAVILSIGFIDRVRDTFTAYFNKASGKIASGHY